MAHSDALKNALARAKANRAKNGIVTDMERILAMVRAERDADYWAGRWTKTLARRGTVAHALRPFQGDALECARRSPAPLGLAVVAGVGHGKTGAGFLIPEVWGAERPALWVPTDVYRQCMADLEWWAESYRFVRPKVWTHHQVSSKKSWTTIVKYSPDVIVIDEAHAFMSLTSARTVRLVKYMIANPTTRLVIMSGTMTSVSIFDCLHLMELALRNGTPLPIDKGVAEVWSSVLDVGGDPDSTAWRALAPLVHWATETEGDAILQDMYSNPRKAVRRAWNLRLKTTPNVVVTQDSACSNALVIHPRRGVQDPNITTALAHLKDTWCLPDGTELVTAPQVALAAKCLSLGFYYRWTWPDGQVDTEFMEARKAWAATVRSWMEYHALQSDLDSPGLLERACREGKGPKAVQAVWDAWEPFSDRPLPPREARWFSHAALEDVAKWVDSRERGLIWYRHQTVGDKLAEVLGLRTYGAGMGDAPDHEDFPALSIMVHRRGKNYQGDRGRKGWADNYVLEPPGGGKVWEQLIGRTHRPGQRSHQVDVSVASWTWPLRRALENAIAQAEYAEHMTGNRQKLCMASWDVPMAIHTRR